MTAVMNAADTGARDINSAAQAAEAMADGLTAHGFDVGNPASQGSCYLKVTNVRAALADLIISPNGTVDWEYRSCDGSRHDPDEMTAIVLTILSSGDVPSVAALASRCPHATLKGMIGRAAADHAMNVVLDVLDRDETFFEIYAEITVTNPAEPRRGTVRVTDDGAIWWRCRISDHARGTDGLDVTEITDTIARALTRFQTT